VVTTTLRIYGTVAVTCASRHRHGFVDFTLAYDSREPLILRLEITDSTGKVYPWQLSRDLVDEGTCGVNGFDVTGVGDVTLKIRESDTNQVTLRLPGWRNSAKKFAYVIFNRDQLRGFVENTYQLVPSPAEVDLLDLDRIDQLVEEWSK
jgi:hypothetical protein